MSVYKYGAMIRMIKHSEQRETKSKDATRNVKRFRMEHIANLWRVLFESVV